MKDTKMALDLLPGVAVSASAPQTVILPLHLANPLKIDRRLVITKRDQQVPAAVVGWLRNDARYSAWFAEAQPQVSEGGMIVQAQSAPPNAPQTPPANEPNAGRNQADAPEGEPWSTTMHVPELREYAKRHGIELKSSDVKGDIIATLLAERGQFEAQPGAGEEDGEDDGNGE